MCLAVPARVLAVDNRGTAVVDSDGLLFRVSTACVPGVRRNDYVLCHAGCAIAVIDPLAARQTLADWGLADGD